MKNITLKVIVSLVCCSLVIALILSSAAITKSKDVLQDEVKKELLYASQKYANQFSTELEIQENVVDIICTTVSVNFIVEEYTSDRERFIGLEKRLDVLLEAIMDDIPETMSLYFTFEPEASGANDEVWYLRNENGEVYYLEADNTVEDWLVDDGSVESAYYFEAVRNSRNWSGVEYDKYLDIYSVTYSRACLDKNGELIGVMGMDIFIDNIFDTVRNIQLEEGGYAFLMDDNYNYLAGSTSKELFDEMKKNGVLDIPSDPWGIVSFADIDGERYLTSYAATSNGWVMALVQSENSLLLPIKHMKQMLYTMAALILIGVFAYSFYFFKKSIAPIVKEFEEKDIIMLHQSRQAKLGEMVGNIAHQWKQPLNVMSITISNLWDDFRHNELTEQQLKEHIEDMRSYIKNMSSTVDDFADFLKPSRKKEEFSVGEAIDTALGLMQESIKINRITVIKEIEENLNALGYRNEFCQGIFNILNNARDAIIDSAPEKREIRIKIYSKNQVRQKAAIMIDIINEGNQIPEDAMALLFQPYFTTKEEKGGTGIGLYLTKEIIEAHMRGSIQLLNAENGVCCRIMIPKEVHE